MNEEKKSLSVPVAIIIAGALIAMGIYFSGRAPAPAPTGDEQPKADVKSIKAPSQADRILGNPNATIVLVEYSDIECPFCKQFHATLHQLMNEYGSQGKLAWVFRHFPVHANSVKEGEAAECAGELGGNEGFWKYIDEIFDRTPSNDGLPLTELPKIAEDIGLDVAKFTACLDSGKFKAKIEQDRADIIAAGARGTPYSILFAKGERIPITQGALPYPDMKTIIDTILKD